MLAACSILGAADPRTGVPIAYLWTILILAGVILGAAGIIVLVGRWAKRTNSAARSSADDRASFRVLYERGGLTQEEYEKIRDRLTQKLRQELKVPADKPAADRPPPASQAPPEANPLPAQAQEAKSEAAASPPPDGQDTSSKPT